MLLSSCVLVACSGVVSIAKLLPFLNLRFEVGTVLFCYDAGKYPLMLMGGRAEGLTCTDPGARTPIGVSGISKFVILVQRNYQII